MTRQQIVLRGRRVLYDVLVSEAALQTRVRVGPGGVEVVRPASASNEHVSTFLRRHENWVLTQLDRVASLGALRRPVRLPLREILYRGEPTPVRVEVVETKARGNIVRWIDGKIIVRRGREARTSAAHGLENWLRRQARTAIWDLLPTVASRIGQQPGRVYVMGQRTKWGNCSHRRNLSFNWRLILAPDFVFHYLVAHEVVHLAIPDHSARFWLTVQSLCPRAERAKQWLSRHHAQLTVDLGRIFEPGSYVEGDVRR